MKKFLTIFLLVSSTFIEGVSQNFPLDESGEIVYQEIIELDSLKKNRAYQNGLKWFKSFKREQAILTKKDSIEGNLYGHSSILVYDQAGVFRKLSGKISYSISIDVKDGKYRYQFYDFVFHYYKQDRNYNMVDTEKTKRLKEDKANGWQKLWNKHRISANEETIKNINSLKAAMKEIHSAPVDKAKPKKVEW